MSVLPYALTRSLRRFVRIGRVVAIAIALLSVEAGAVATEACGVAIAI